jgi:hypothetical protein
MYTAWNYTLATLTLVMIGRREPWELHEINEDWRKQNWYEKLWKLFLMGTMLVPIFIFGCFGIEFSLHRRKE